jgi:hypothetical protein
MRWRWTEGPLFPLEDIYSAEAVCYTKAGRMNVEKDGGKDHEGILL